MSGTDIFYNAGDIVDVDDEKAELFCKRGIAIAADEPKINKKPQQTKNKKDIANEDKENSTK